MQRGVQPAAVEVEAQRDGDRAAQDLLPVDGVIDAQDLRVGLARRGGQLLGERDQLRLEHAEDGFHLAGGIFGIIVLQQRVVGLVLPAETGGHLAADGHEAGELGQQEREVGALAGGRPDALAERGGVRQLAHERGGNPGQALILAAQQPQVGGLGAVPGHVGGGQFGQQPAHPLAGRFLVQEARQVRQFARAVRRGGTGQIDLLVPAQRRHDPAQLRELPAALQEPAIRASPRVHGHVRHLPPAAVNKAPTVMEAPGRRKRRERRVGFTLTKAPDLLHTGRAYLLASLRHP